ncbi:DUF1611 domain-containing protein [bacterium]|nr:DUF1611 domain-containing protein [bacterium]
MLLYSEHRSIGMIDSANVGKKCQDLLGAGGSLPIRSEVSEFLGGPGESRPDTLIIGVTPVGGQLPPEMRRHVLAAIEAGMDVWSGLHHFLADDPEISAAAKKAGVRLWDVRKPARDLPVGSGLCCNTQSYTLLAVGTDAAVGKMTAVLEMRKESLLRGSRAEFVATGQTGIMIAGWGHPVDAIAGDFMAGCVEADILKVDGKCDIVYVEGQGSLFHPGFSSVTLGLMHGACPDSMILCHQAGRTHISKREHIPIPPLADAVSYYENVQFPLKPSRVIGVAVNTWGLGDTDAHAAVRAAADETQLPATDPCRFGAGPLVDALEIHRRLMGKEPTLHG